MEPIKSLGDMNGYESSPSTSPENTTRAKEVEEHLYVFRQGSQEHNKKSGKGRADWQAGIGQS